MNVLPEIYHILASVHSKQPLIPATLMYNEGWLLRLALAAEKQGVHCLPFRFADGARWFAETLLHTPFAASSRSDRRAETCTQADGVVGHFDLDEDARLGLRLDDRASQFVVCEAKLFSPLGSRTVTARGFDQAARTVACMAYTLALAKRPVDDYQSLAFYVLAPDSQIKGGRFKEKLNLASIRNTIQNRIHDYEEPRRSRLRRWMDAWVLPLLSCPGFRCGVVSWESVLKKVQQQDVEYGQDLQEFYAFCKQSHAPLSSRPCVWVSPEGEKDALLVSKRDKHCRIRLEDGRETVVPTASLKPQRELAR